MPSVNSLPVYDAYTSVLKSPVLLFEGRSAILIEEEEVSTRVDGGRAVFAEKLASMMIRSNPRKVKQINKDGKEETKILYVLRSIKAFRRKSQPPGLRGQSSKMTPGRPTDGDIATGSYGKLLDAFAFGDKRAVTLFRARKTMRQTEGVSQELFNQTSERSVLFFPHAGLRGKAYKNSILVGKRKAAGVAESA